MNRDISCWRCCCLSGCCAISCDEGLRSGARTPCRYRRRMLRVQDHDIGDLLTKSGLPATEPEVGSKTLPLQHPFGHSPHSPWRAEERLTVEFTPHKGTTPKFPRIAAPHNNLPYHNLGAYIVTIDLQSEQHNITAVSVSYQSTLFLGIARDV